MKPRRIDDQIREYYEGRRLSDDARARVKAMLGSGAPPRHQSTTFSMRAGVAAALAAVVIGATLWLAVFRGPSPDSTRDIASVVVHCAAEGHNERQELEFHVSKTAELRQVMKSLDFTPIEPAMMSGMDMRIVGARYTTLDGVMAAQIRYVDPKGEPCTLYQARPIARLARLPDGDRDVDGLRVSVWRERGLVMVLARPGA